MVTVDDGGLGGTTSAAATYGIEQLCNVAFTGLKFIAPGVTDDLVIDVVENLALKIVGDPAGARALTNIGMLIVSGAGEGVEETLESLLNPFLQRLSYDKNAKTILQDPSLLADAAYEGLIGTVLGLFSRGTNTAIDLKDSGIWVMYPDKNIQRCINYIWMMSSVKNSFWSGTEILKTIVQNYLTQTEVISMSEVRYEH